MYTNTTKLPCDLHSLGNYTMQSPVHRKFPMPDLKLSVSKYSLSATSSKN